MSSSSFCLDIIFRIKYSSPSEVTELKVVNCGSSDKARVDKAYS